MKRILPLVIAAAVVALPVRADSNLVANGSFEDMPSGTYTTKGSYDFVANGTGTPNYVTGMNTTFLDDWAITTMGNGGGYGVVNNSVLTSPGGASGNQSEFMSLYYNGGVDTLNSNSLGTILPNSTYTLTLAVGAPASLSSLQGSHFVAGETAPQVYFALLGNGSNVIDSETLQNTAVSEGTLTDYTLTFSTGASGGYVGQNLSVELKASKQLYGGADPGGETAMFDNVSVTVPEPSSYALMGLGALTILCARWKLRRS